MRPLRATRTTGPRERRQSKRLTKRELRQLLSGPGRKWIKGVWAAAEQYTLRLSRLSPVTSPLGTRLMEEYMAEHNLSGEEMHRALFLALVDGYSTRAVLAGPTEQPALDASSLQADDLDDRTRTIANEEFESVMKLPPEVWKGYVAIATMTVQGKHASATLPWYRLGRSRIEAMIRCGYVLRCIDETLDAEPVLTDVSEAASRG